MLEFEKALGGRRVLLTGHTGFTGSWLTQWLLLLGCSVTGLARRPVTQPNLFEALGHVDALAGHWIADIRDLDRVRALMAEARPEIVFHLAAQPLVRRSYREPIETISINAIGTACVLEAARSTEGVRAVVCITTDKVYENRDWVHPYRETDRLGGKDPYSASKSCAELVVRCYQETMAPLGNGAALAAVRGGNIIGGGDWSEDRIIPDFYRAVDTGSPLVIRNPDAIRPWQHVLSACHGYLAVGAHLLSGRARQSEAWNIGLFDGEDVSVRTLVEILFQHWERPDVEFRPAPLHEDRQLLLDVHKVRTLLGVVCPWGTIESIRRTAAWYRGYREDAGSAAVLTQAQLSDYRAALADAERAGDRRRS